MIPDLIDDKNSSIAIVGNGGSLQGSNSGQTIDDHDFVFRFNNYNLSPEHAPDVGLKTNFWVNTFFVDIKPRSNPPALVCPYPINLTKYLLKYNGTNINFLSLHMDRINFIPESIYLELCDLMPISQCKNFKDPSAGLCMIYWLFKSGYKISFRNLFGFDFFSNKNHHYFSNQPSPSINHEGSIEKRIVESIFNERGDS